MLSQRLGSKGGATPSEAAKHLTASLPRRTGHRKNPKRGPNSNQTAIDLHTTASLHQRAACRCMPSRAGSLDARPTATAATARQRLRRAQSYISGRSWAVGVIILTFAVASAPFLDASMHPQRAQRSSTRLSSIPASSNPTTQPTVTDPPVRIAVLAPLNAPSPLSGTAWGEVLQHMARRLAWTDPSFELVPYDTAELASSEASNAGNSKKDVFSGISGSDIVMAMGVHDAAHTAAALSYLQSARNALALDSAPSLEAVARVNGRNLPIAPGAKDSGGLHSLWAAIQAKISAAAHAEQQHVKALNAVRDLYLRRTSDDLVFSFLVFINEAVRAVPAVANSTKQANVGLPELQCMVTKCGGEIFGCLADATCRTALDCLNGCSYNDQVCSYRCIASYETPALAAFSLCILQKHNCLGLSASIPETPNPAPMTTFRGDSLTHEVAEDLFIGWLRGTDTSITRDASNLAPFSWRVFGGKNAAYDHFPCQYQLFFRGKARNSFWYQPVFQVKTLDGRQVWRDRVYRVRRGTTPGSFKLSVLDNGVTSLEHWRILDCAEDLEWCAFYYSGAAKAAGLSYTGAILTSRTGEWPGGDAARARIEAALDTAGIKPWELSSVSNAGCEGAPLTLAAVAAMA